MQRTTEPALDVPLTFEEARAILKVSSSTLYRYTSTRVITYYKPNGRNLYFRRADLDAFVFRNAQIARPQSGTSRDTRQQASPHPDRLTALREATR